MHEYRLKLTGFTLKESKELEAEINAVEGVSAAKLQRPTTRDTAFDPSRPVAAITDFQMVIHVAQHLTDTLILSSAVERVAGRSVDKIVDAIAEAAVSYVRNKFSGKSNVEPAAELYGPDGKLLRHEKGKR